MSKTLGRSSRCRATCSTSVSSIWTAWHLSRLRSGGREYRGYAATGNGGQILLVVPDLDLTVVFTAGNYGQGGIWGRYIGEIVGNEIIPAIRP